MTIRDQLAEFCSSLEFEDLPPEVVDFTRILIMDQILRTTAGAGINLEVEYFSIARFIKKMGGEEESSLVSQGCKVPCVNAAFSNTVLSFGGFDGLHRSAIHLPCCLIPATVAVAERQHASGKDLILATVIGSEIIARIGLALGANHVYDRGFHPTSLCAPFGCAVAAGRLLGLGRNVLAEALSIAALQGAGARPWPQFPRAPETTHIQVGRAAQGGVMSAFLAQMGVIGIRDILEHPAGFLTAHSGSPDPAKLTEGLGTVYEIKKTTLKRFGVGIYVIPGLEALLELLQKHQIQAENIERMTYKLPTAVVPLVGSAGYPSGEASREASKSSRYLLAFTAYKGEEGIILSHEYQSPANLGDPRHIALFKKVDVVADAEMDKFFPGTWPCKLTVRTNDGNEFTRFHDGSVKGSPENPLSQEEIEKKFSKIVAPALPKKKFDQMLGMLRRLEEVNDVSNLASLMASKS